MNKHRRHKNDSRGRELSDVIADGADSEHSDHGSCFISLIVAFPAYGTVYPSNSCSASPNRSSGQRCKVP